jgi:hypothetical protein
VKPAWTAAKSIKADGKFITGVTGTPALIQGWFGNRNLEMMVPQGNQLVHYYRDNSDTSQSWRRGATAIDLSASGETVVGASLFQSNYGIGGGDLQVLARIRPKNAGEDNDYLQLVTLNTKVFQWTAPITFKLGDGGIDTVPTGISGF